MCPKVQSHNDREQDVDLNGDMRSDKMIHSTLWSIYSEEKEDSGLGYTNLPSLNLYNMSENEELRSVENAFWSLTIDCGVQQCQQDSGVYTSVQHSSQNYEIDDIDRICESRCAEEKMVMNNTFDSESTTHNWRSNCRIPEEHVHELFEGDRDGDNKLHLSIINGHQEFSHKIINLAPDYCCLSYCNRLRQTPLHLAVLTSQHSVVRRLICAGAVVIAQNKEGDTPLHIACRLGDSVTVKHLLTPVRYEETLQNRYSIPYQRVPQDLRARNYEGQTCLHIAASFGHYDVVQMLLKAGADINLGDGKSGRSVLHLAADRGDADLVELLLAWSDTNVEKKDYAGFTPIQLAYGRRHVDIVKIICNFSDVYEGIHLSDLERSFEDEGLSDDSDTSDCPDAFSIYR